MIFNYISPHVELRLLNNQYDKLGSLQQYNKFFSTTITGCVIISRKCNKMALFMVISKDMGRVLTKKLYIYKWRK